MSEFSTSKGKEIIKNQTDKRVCKDAADTLIQGLEDYASERAEEIIEETHSTDRKTVRAEDVQNTR